MLMIYFYSFQEQHTPQAPLIHRLLTHLHCYSSIGTVHPRIHSHSLTHSFTRSLNLLLSFSLTHLVTCVLTHSFCILTDLDLVHSLTHLAHSVTHAHVFDCLHYHLPTHPPTTALLLQTLSTALVKAERENATVYLQRVPNFADLAPIQPYILVKSLSLPDIDAAGETLFQTVIPDNR